AFTAVFEWVSLSIHRLHRDYALRCEKSSRGRSTASYIDRSNTNRETGADVILIASASARVCWYWREGLARLGPVTAVEDLTSLIEVLVLRIPRVLLVDVDLAGPEEIAKLRRRCPATRIVILSGPLSDDAEFALFMSGARGCCRYDAKPELQERLVKAVERGELWLRRSI